MKKQTAKKVLLAVVSFSAIITYQNCAPSFQSNLADAGSSSNSSTLPGDQGSGSQPEPGKGPPALPPPVALGGTITSMKIENLGNSEQTNVPVTFGQVFVPGGMLATDTIAGKLSNGQVLALQVEEKAKHDDGSLRHAVITAVIPKLAVGQKETLSLVKASKVSSLPSTATPNDLYAAGFGASVSINLEGTVYTASPDAGLKGGIFQTWLQGPLMNEWIVKSPLKTSAGVAHPHLMARFNVRSYSGLNRARVDFILENNWAYEPAPQNFTYDVQLFVGGQSVYAKTGLTHYNHARWRKTFWWGQDPLAHVAHDPKYLVSTRAIPNYDLSLVIPENRSIYPDAAYGGLVQMKNEWSGARIEPMGTGWAERAMGATGGRIDIGLFPGWAIKYLISQDARAKLVTLESGNLAGSYPSHYRDQKTDLPLSIVDWPYSSLLGNPGDLNNPKTGKNEAFPVCGGDCASPNEPDISHQPNFNYLPYLITGDHFQLEELQFWAMYDVFAYNPYRREFEKGLVVGDQVRGQGWGLRTLGEAAYITPDNHPLKAQFNSFVSNNLDWFNKEYTNNPSANVFGIIVNGYALGYNDGKGMSPWMDDFFTQSIGHLAELGFKKAEPLLAWKSKFVISRMTDPDFCWIFAGSYFLNVRDSDTSPFYTSIKQVYQTTHPTEASLGCNSPEMAAALKLKVGEMTGYADGTEGYPANMQPALSFAVTSGAANGSKAWQVFNARTVKPDYSASPQFAIYPRE